MKIFRGFRSQPSYGPIFQIQHSMMYLNLNMILAITTASIYCEGLKHCQYYGCIFLV